MLLCKQPGDTGVFATATHGRIAIYCLSSPSRLLHAAAAATKTEATSSTAVQPSETPIVGAEHPDARLTSATRSGSAAAPASMHTTARRRWGAPLLPSCVIPAPLLRGSGVGETGD
ncbi:hypothetical protein DQ04_08671000, partial [Trypanosoma grayi]|uniref:hypothetical protein n=1 Tax=Trypanosoma grayi TaxID=71804 RepID=UPI0004F43FD9